MGKDSVKWISHYVLFTRIANLAVISLEPLIDGEYYSFTRDTFLKKKKRKKIIPISHASDLYVVAFILLLVLARYGSKISSYTHHSLCIPCVCSVLLNKALAMAHNKVFRYALDLRNFSTNPHLGPDV